MIPPAATPPHPAPKAPPVAAYYLGRLRSAKTPSHMATMLRALGCVLAAELSTDGAAETHRRITRYETHARQIERAGSYGEARIHLRQWGYVQ